MARIPRYNQICPETPHHVVVRGNNRRNLFSDCGDRLLFLRFLTQAIERTNCRVHHLTLLNNHVHLVMTPPSVDALSDCVKRFCQSYAYHRNCRHHTTGKLFEQRFWSKAITSETYMAVVSAYVDLNLQLANIPPRYRRFSMLGLHVGDENQLLSLRSLWTPSAWYLGLGTSAQMRAESYQTWLVEYESRREELHAQHCVAVDRLPAKPRRHLERPDRSSVI